MKIAIFFILYGCCSVFLTTFNKKIMLLYPYAWTTLLFQNIGTLVITLIAHLCRFNDQFVVKPIQKHHVFPGCVMGVAFVLNLGLSFYALQGVSVPLYVVVRSMTPVFTAVLEYLFLKSVISRTKVLGLVVTILGTLIYVQNDESSQNLDGLSAVIANSVLVAATSTYEKKTMGTMKEEQTAMGINLYRVTFSLPLVVLFIRTLERQAFDDFWESETEVYMAVSSVFGFGIGVFLFCLQREVKATSIQVSNIFYKVVTTVVASLMFPTNVAMLGWFGYLVTFGGIVLYTFGENILKKKQEGEYDEIPTWSSPGAWEKNDLLGSDPILLDEEDDEDFMVFPTTIDYKSKHSMTSLGSL